MKTFKFSLLLCTREHTDVLITLDDNIYGIHSKRVNILYVIVENTRAQFTHKVIKILCLSVFKDDNMVVYQICKCLGGSVWCAIRLETRRSRVHPRRGCQHSFVEIDHEIFSTVILSLPLIQEGQLSVSGERMCTILVKYLRGLSLSSKCVVR